MANFHRQINCMRVHVCLRKLSSARSSSLCLRTTCPVWNPQTSLLMTHHLTLSSQMLQSWRKSRNCERTTSASGFPNGFFRWTQTNRQSRQWRNWDNFNVDTYRKSSWGCGGRCEPPAGFGAAPRKFVKFMVSLTWEDLFWQILENFLGFLLQKFSVNERPVCNMWLLGTAQSCVCLDGTPQKLFPMFLVRKSDVHWHRYLLCTFTQRRPCSCWTTRTLVFFDVDEGVALSHHSQVCLLLCMNLRSPIARPKLSFS